MRLSVLENHLCDTYGLPRPSAQDLIGHGQNQLGMQHWQGATQELWDICDEMAAQQSHPTYEHSRFNGNVENSNSYNIRRTPVRKTTNDEGETSGVNHSHQNHKSSSPVTGSTAASGDSTFDDEIDHMFIAAKNGITPPRNISKQPPNQIFLAEEEEEDGELDPVIEVGNTGSSVGEDKPVSSFFNMNVSTTSREQTVSMNNLSPRKKPVANSQQQQQKQQVHDEDGFPDVQPPSTGNSPPASRRIQSRGDKRGVCDFVTPPPALNYGPATPSANNGRTARRTRRHSFHAAVPMDMNTANPEIAGYKIEQPPKDSKKESQATMKNVTQNMPSFSVPILIFQKEGWDDDISSVGSFDIAFPKGRDSKRRLVRSHANLNEMVIPTREELAMSPIKAGKPSVLPLPPKDNNDGNLSEGSREKRVFLPNNYVKPDGTPVSMSRKSRASDGSEFVEIDIMPAAQPPPRRRNRRASFHGFGCIDSNQEKQILEQVYPTGATPMTMNSSMLPQGPPSMEPSVESSFLAPSKKVMPRRMNRPKEIQLSPYVRGPHPISPQRTSSTQQLLNQLTATPTQPVNPRARRRSSMNSGWLPPLLSQPPDRTERKVDVRGGYTGSSVDIDKMFQKPTRPTRRASFVGGVPSRPTVANRTPGSPSITQTNTAMLTYFQKHARSSEQQRRATRASITGAMRAHTRRDEV